MAGMGPPPKDPKLRQRRNRTSTAATLRLGGSSDEATPAVVKTPELPVRGSKEKPWHAETVKFWSEVWSSPMAAEYIAADIPGLIVVAELMDAFNYGDLGVAAEIRLQRQCFGLTPLDRRRLQWEIERAESAGRRRQPGAQTAASTATGTRDPRRTLRAVK